MIDDALEYYIIIRIIEQDKNFVIGAFTATFLNTHMFVVVMAHNFSTTPIENKYSC